jgi:hypothetical protein
MNEREEFLQYIQSVLAEMVERIETMTESQVLDGLRDIKAARSVYVEELAERFKTMTETEGRNAPREVKAVPNMYRESPDSRNYIQKLRSQQDFFNAITKLRSQLSSRPRPGGSPPVLFDSIEDALKRRLETLRTKGN